MFETNFESVRRAIRNYFRSEDALQEDDPIEGLKQATPGSEDLELNEISEIVDREAKKEIFD